MKIDKPTDKENYRPVSKLPLLSNVFIYHRLSAYLEKYILQFPKGSFHSKCTFQTFSFFQAWKHGLDISGLVETILMNLPKVYYDCFSHDSLLARFEVYDTIKTGLNLWNIDI